MNFSLDSNIIIGLVNTKHPLHETSIYLIQGKRNDNFFLCHTVLKESQTVLRNRINEIMAEMIRFLPSLQEISKLGSFKLTSLIIEEFKQIINTNPRLEDFVNLIYEEIEIFLKDNPTERLPDFLSQLSLRYSKSIQRKLEEIHPISYKISLKRKNLSAVKEALTEIEFEDTNDLRIFQELMTNLNEIKPAEFFSNDLEFIKKCEQGYAKIVNHLGFDNRAISFKLL